MNWQTTATFWRESAEYWKESSRYWRTARAWMFFCGYLVGMFCSLLMHYIFFHETC